MKTLDDAQIGGKNVLIIVDYNVQIVDGQMMSTFKVDQTVETIRVAMSKSPKALAICTHLGRPESRKEYSTIPIFNYLSSIFERLRYVEIETIVGSGLEHGDLVFTDNSRYYSHEQRSEFYGTFDLIVNDAFGCAHRPVSCRAYAGLLMEREVRALKSLKHCDLLIMGGAKISDKLKLLERFSCKIFLSGCLGVSVLKHMGLEVGGRSLCADYDSSHIVGRVSSGEVILPVDFKVQECGGEYMTKDRDCIESTDAIIDIGTKSAAILMDLVDRSKMIFWNGPVGKFEDPQASATGQLVQKLATSGSKVLVGGGETTCAILSYSSVDKFHHVSTGGGALLCFLCGEKMPGIESIYE